MHRMITAALFCLFAAEFASAQISSGAVMMMINETAAGVDGSGNAVTTYNTLVRGFDDLASATNAITTLSSVSTYSLITNPCSQASSDSRCTQGCVQDTTNSQIYQCACNSGYTDYPVSTAQTPSTVNQPGINCTDNDECAATSNLCGTGQNTCTNTAGSWSCSCNFGYLPSSDGLSCEVSDSPFSAGPVLVMVNESTTNIAGDGVTVTTTYATILRGFDNESAALDGIVVLASIARYSIILLPCSEAAATSRCVQTCLQNTTTGIYQCQCNSGYNDTTTATVASSTLTQAGFVCTDLDECSNATVCGTGQTNCTNTAGSYECACGNGYTADANLTSCENLDECSNSTLNTCDTNANCTDTTGSFTCTCNDGFTGNGTTCTAKCCGADLDECAVNNYNCSGNGNCTNIAGGYTCTCNTGYSLNSTADPLTCEDTDECLNTSSCHANATCANTVGSFTCTCNSGTTGDGQNCTDLDECSNSTLNDCDGNATCTNTVGSWSCACNANYTGNGTTCTDIDECTSGTHQCDANANCTNTAGGYTCACNSGYSGDGFNCTDINECATNTSNCDGNATCTNTLGSFTCACNLNYAGDGTSGNCTYSVGSLEYCYRAMVNASAVFTSYATGAHIKADLIDALNATMEQYRSTDNTLGYLDLVNITVDAFTTGTNGIVVSFCLTNVSKTADELTALMASITSTHTISGFSLSFADYNECTWNYPQCSALSTCTNTNGSYTCTCASGYYDNSTAPETGVECVQGVSYTCTGTYANVTLVNSYFTSVNINVSDIFINTNCSGTTTGDYHEYYCSGITSTNSTHLVAAFTIADVIRTYSTNRINTTFYCTQPATQNLTANLNGVDTVVDTNIPIYTSSSSSSLSTSVSVGGYSNAASSGVATGELACIQVGDSNLAADISIVFEDCWTGAPGDSAQFTLLEDHCPVESTGLTVETSDDVSGGICFTMHRPSSSNVLEVIMQVQLCDADDCPNVNCGKRKRRSLNELSRKKRSSETRRVTTLIQVSSEDTCTKDCGHGACVLDFAQQPQCICGHSTFKNANGTCVDRVATDDAVMGDSVTETTKYILIGLGALLLLLLVILIVVLVVRRRNSQNQKDLELSYVHQHAITAVTQNNPRI